MESVSPRFSSGPPSFGTNIVAVLQEFIAKGDSRKKACPGAFCFIAPVLSGLQPEKCTFLENCSARLHHSVLFLLTGWQCALSVVGGVKKKKQRGSYSLTTMRCESLGWHDVIGNHEEGKLIRHASRAGAAYKQTVQFFRGRVITEGPQEWFCRFKFTMKFIIYCFLGCTSHDDPVITVVTFGAYWYLQM